MGAVIRLLMNRHNARMNAFAVRQLKLEPSDRVLEIGFGGALPSLMDAAAFIAGVDRSDDVIGWAKRRFARQIRTGRADFRQGESNRLCSSRRRRQSLHGQHRSFLVLVGQVCRFTFKPRGRVLVFPKERMDLMRMPEDTLDARTA